MSPEHHHASVEFNRAFAIGIALAGKLRTNPRHTYGWKRASILAAFANASLLFVAMGSLAWEAIGKLAQPSVAAGGTIMAVAAVGKWGQSTRINTLSIFFMAWMSFLSALPSATERLTEPGWPMASLNGVRVLGLTC